MGGVSVQQQGERWVAVCGYEQRAIPKEAGFRWDPAAKRWWTNKPEIAAKLATPEAAERLRQQAEQKHKLQQEAVVASRAEDAEIEVPAPAGLEYLPYQRAGIAYALRQRRVLFGDEMGLGKTIQAIGALNGDATIHRTVVICPASLKLNWRNELRRWLVRPTEIIVCSGDDAPFDWFPGIGKDIVFVMNYDICARHEKAMKAVAWDAAIIDEGHYLKNDRAKRTLAIFGGKVKHENGTETLYTPLPARLRMILTGTPIPNRPAEGFPLFHYLDPENWKSKWTYAKLYCGYTETRFGHDTSGATNLDKLQERLRSTIMVRRLKADVLKELPAKRRSVIEIPATGAAAKLVGQELDAFAAHEDRIAEARTRAELAKASDDPAEYAAAVEALKAAASVAFTEMSAIRHETALATVPFIVEQLKDLIDDQGLKVLVFAHHRDVIDQIRGAFEGRAVHIVGGMPVEERQHNVERFQSDERIRLFVGGIMAAGVGLTLTASSHVVFAELDWVPGNVTQAEDRAHRIGQKDMVTVQHYVLEGSLSAKMARTLVAKQDVIDRALDRRAEPASAEPVMPESNQAATESVSRDRVAKQAEQMTPERIELIHAGLKLLAGMDTDHAREINGMGFSKFDGGIGHSLARAIMLSPKQAVLGAKLVTKYRRQLSEDIVEAARI